MRMILHAPTQLTAMIREVFSSKAGDSGGREKPERREINSPGPGLQSGFSGDPLKTVAFKISKILDPAAIDFARLENRL
jgi:hypothetical protein